MREQIHGGDIYRNQGVIDFSVNSNPLGLPDGVLETLKSQAGQIVHYPDVRCGELRKSIGQLENMAEENILCGNGAAELLFAAVLAVRPRRALLAVPTFSEYERALALTDTKIIYYELKEDQNFQLKKDIMLSITPELDLMFLCNPNNPTGQIISRPLLYEILKKCRECGTYLVLDECFLDFLEEPQEYEMRTFCREYPNLLIIKAFTKLFCMPGLRLGYAMSGNQELLDKMEAALQPWNISVPAQICGVAALNECGGYLEQTRQFIAEERDFMETVLDKAGYHVYHSQANYLFFRGKPGLYEDALSAGFLIRDCRNYRGLSEGYYRIAVRSREENRKLAEWLGKRDMKGKIVIWQRKL